MQLTVVIPVRNRAGIVERTLDSVFMQSLRPLKVVIVDNGSTDGTGDVLRQWVGRVRSDDFVVTVVDEPVPGACRARNRGLAEVDTPWTMFFDSDDEMLPGHLSRVAAAISNSPQVDIFGWDVACDSGRELLLRFEPQDIAYHNIMHGALATQRYCARTDIFRRAGGWCESLSKWNDIELGTRILALKPKILKLDGKPTVLVHNSQDSLTGPSFAATLNRCMSALAEIRKSYSSVGSPAHIRLKQVILGADSVREGNDRGYDCLRGAIDDEQSRVNRIIYRCAFRYRLSGGRGAARLFHKLLVDVR